MRSNAHGPAKETDLYRPLRDYLEAQGYAVRSEVKGCDVVAERDGEAIVLELKRNLSVSLLAQAVDRQRAFGSVYVVLPHPGRRVRSREWRAACRLLKRLELGLVLVDLRAADAAPNSPETHVVDAPREPDGARLSDGPVAGTAAVQVVFHPIPPERRTRKEARRAVLTELRGRSMDLNEGGSTGRKIVTAYRESAVQIGCYLKVFGPLSPARLRKMGTGPKTASILARDFYGWFERIGRGVYALTGPGSAGIRQYPELMRLYSERAEEIAGP
jgi:hypothetical protein